MAMNLILYNQLHSNNVHNLGNLLETVRKVDIRISHRFLLSSFGPDDRTLGPFSSSLNDQTRSFFSSLLGDQMPIPFSFLQGDQKRNVFFSGYSIDHLLS